jgi:hypothetical protein
MLDWVLELSKVANYVVAIGDCAAWGGIPAVPPNPTDSTGMQFHKDKKGGFLGEGFQVEGWASGGEYPRMPRAPRLDDPNFGRHLLPGVSSDVLIDDFHRPKDLLHRFCADGLHQCDQLLEEK